VARLAAQFCSAGLALLLLPSPGADWPLAPLVVFFAAVMIVWVTNLFNFMDGMDGLAGSQAVLVYAIMGVWLSSRGAVELTAFCLIASAATAAFLVVNWHPARVFMGDSGSLALGIGIAIVSFAGVVQYGLPLAAFFLLMGVFLFDATFTLLRRMWNRERWWQSHRSHLYQRAHALGLSQRRIVSIVIGIDLVLAALGSLLVYGSVPQWLPVAGAMIVIAVPAIWVYRLEAQTGAGSSFR
jgi:UDP-N-acetylmuramyl pentapeptide phosphotransferase/UDP-N-acetylglucosamine-1-phosphate transferase